MLNIIKLRLWLNPESAHRNLNGRVDGIPHDFTFIVEKLIELDDLSDN
jgi:hypothetical protein